METPVREYSEGLFSVKRGASSAGVVVLFQAGWGDILRGFYRGEGDMGLRGHSLSLRDGCWLDTFF